MTEEPRDARTVARAKFQHARDALFFARLIAEIDRSRESRGEVGALVSAVERANGYNSPVPLVNQTLLLQMAYMTLVYPKEGDIGMIVGKWKPGLDWKRVNVIADTNGRFAKSEAWEQLLRTVRNSLAHSSIEVEDKRFVFTDSWKGESVKVAFGWDFLGELTIEFFLAANEALFDVPRDGGAQMKTGDIVDGGEA